MPIVVLVLLFDKLQLKHNDQISLKDFQQQLKCHITWLKSMGYQSVLKSPEYLTNAVRRLLNSLRKRFYKYTRNIVNCEDFLSLKQFQIWLENRVKEQCNPIANILASDEAYKNRDNPIRSNNFSNKNISTDREIKCWLSENKHKITSCDQFKVKSYSEKKRFVEQEKLCCNCLAKGHILKNCESKIRYRVSNCHKRYLTLLHEDIPLKSNGVQHNSFNKSSTRKTFLQIVPVAISMEIVLYVQTLLLIQVLMLQF